MAQSPRIKKFKTKDGSTWTIKELNWLAVHFKDECDIEDVFFPDTELSGQIAQYLRSELLDNKPSDWEQLRKIRHGASSWYSRLFFLDTVEEKQQYYSPSTATSTQASSAQKDQKSQRSSSQDSVSTSVYDRHLSATPTPRPGPLKMHMKHGMLATDSSPSDPKSSESPEVREGTRASKRAISNERRNLFGVRDPIQPWSNETNPPIKMEPRATTRPAAAAAGSAPSSSPKGTTFLATNYPSWETSSDTAWTDNSSHPNVSESDSTSDRHDEEREEEDENDVYDEEDDKYENDVLSAAQAFLYLLTDAFRGVVEDLRLIPVTSRKLDIPIDGVLMTSHPDTSLRLTTKTNDASKTDPEIELVIECKRKKNKLSVNRKLAQEASELLGDVKRQWAYGKPRDRYTAYLISWHHLECYISRLDVAEKYLDKLDKDTARLQHGPHPLIKRSRKFDLTNADQRVRFTLLAAHLLVDQMTVYNRHKQLVKRLLE